MRAGAGRAIRRGDLLDRHRRPAYIRSDGPTANPRARVPADSRPWMEESGPMADVVSGTPRVPATAPGETATHAPPTAERAVKMGRGEALPIRALPAAWNPVHILGPGMVLTALGVGIGETFQWPRMVTIFGPNVRILFLLGVTIQLFVMMEMGRYALATGESIFFGAARLHPAVMWFFWLVAMLVYIWPGHVTLGAQSLETLTGKALPWVPTAIAGIVLIGLVLTFAPVAYSAVETVLTILIGVMVIGSAIIPSLV